MSGLKELSSLSHCDFSCSSSKGWSDKDWRRLWSDLVQISKAGGFSCLDPRELLSGFVQTLLDAGRVSLAHAFLAGEEAGEGIRHT
jgi:hypothetical protein